MSRTPVFVFLTLFTISFFVSCQDSYDICDKPRTVLLKSGFYQIISGVETPSTVSSFSLEEIGGKVLYDQQPLVSTFTTTLNAGKNSVSYIIKVAAILPADTLTVVYSSRSENLSPECGAVNVFTLSEASVTSHSIDSVRLVLPDVNTTSGENLRIFY